MPDPALELARTLQSVLSTRELDELLIREGYLVATPCQRCLRDTMWRPGEESSCICVECA